MSEEAEDTLLLLAGHELALKHFPMTRVAHSSFGCSSGVCEPTESPGGRHTCGEGLSKKVCVLVTRGTPSTVDVVRFPRAGGASVVALDGTKVWLIGETHVSG